MGYSECLEKAGCTLLAFKEFGDYQGTWVAFVEYEGAKGIVEGSYGSCSGCDAFQAEFDYSEPCALTGKYYRTGRTWSEDDECTKEEYDVALIALEKRYADFGQSYLAGGTYPKSHYEAILEKINKQDESDWFSNEEKEICEWVISQDWD